MERTVATGSPPGAAQPLPCMKPGDRVVPIALNSDRYVEITPRRMVDRRRHRARQHPEQRSQLADTARARRTVTARARRTAREGSPPAGTVTGAARSAHAAAKSILVAWRHTIHQ